MLLKRLLHIRLGYLGFILMIYNFWIWTPLIVTVISLSWNQNKLSEYLENLADKIRIYLIPFHLVSTLISSYFYFFLK